MDFLKVAGLSLLPWTIAGGAGLGAIKHFAVDKPQEEKDRELASQTARYSPWTGLKPQPVERASLFKSALQGLGAGLGAAQTFGSFGGGGGEEGAAFQQQKLMQKRNPWDGLGMSGIGPVSSGSAYSTALSQYE